MNKKGFTLIELLVVIAVLGILASVVLVAINPTARMNEAKDASAKTHVSEVATGVETCYTKNEGSYTNCDTNSKLTTGGFVKTMPSGVTVCASGTEVMVESALSGTSRWWQYSTLSGAFSEVAADPCP